MSGATAVIGLIADTHGLLRPQVASVFAGVDFIVHAGDVGSAKVLAALSTIAPVYAVSGNVDDRHDPTLTAARTLPAGALTLHVSHGDKLGRPTPAALLARYSADIIVYGHTHRALVMRAGDGRLVVNPGAAGPRRFNLEPSVAVLTVNERHAEVRIVSLAE